MKNRSGWACLPIAASLFLGLMATPAVAQDAAQPSNPWRFMVGLGVAAVPDYEGSSNYKAAPLPVASVRKGQVFGRLFGLKLTSNLIPHPNFRAGPVVNYRAERDDVEDDAVDDLKKVDAAVEVGAVVGYDLPFENGLVGAEVEFVHDVADGHDGWLLTPEVHYQRALNDRWGMQLAFSMTYASDNYMESYFEISPRDSARSRLPVSTASAGFKDLGLNLALNYKITDHWGLGMVGGWTRLVGDAEDSPVTKRGSKDQFIAGLYVSYAWMSQ